MPKIESHLEARLWNDVFVAAQEALGEGELFPWGGCGLIYDAGAGPLDHGLGLERHIWSLMGFDDLTLLRAGKGGQSNGSGDL